MRVPYQPCMHSQIGVKHQNHFVKMHLTFQVIKKGCVIITKWVLVKQYLPHLHCIRLSTISFYMTKNKKRQHLKLEHRSRHCIGACSLCEMVCVFKNSTQQLHLYRKYGMASVHPFFSMCSTRSELMQTHSSSLAIEYSLHIIFGTSTPRIIIINENRNKKCVCIFTTCAKDIESARSDSNFPSSFSRSFRNWK